ncbi:LysR family transcriptional regulator, regulator for bpeEF and oprC [Pararobbsia alpina]|uniref:LysR family transcriptional regulator n=1 Tax=Pararobbsia alpina TaxID=621374 RepID=UPI0039A4E8CC
MDHVQAMEVFTRVVDANSFTRAAEQLAMPRASVTTTIQNLEARLGVRLIHRTTRRISITPEGAAYYEHCARIIADIAETDAYFQHGARKAEGSLRVHMSVSLGRQLVIPALKTFHQEYPDIKLDISLSDRRVDLVEEGLDCMIRVGPLEDSSLIGRRIGVLKRVTCAAPEYLARHGEPDDLESLADHRAVNFRAHGGRSAPWIFTTDGRLHEVNMHGIVSVNDSEAYLTCGVEGLGLIQPTLYEAASHLQSGALREVLTDWNPQPKPIYIVYAKSKHPSIRIRTFCDWVASLFESLPEFLISARRPADS